MIDKHVNTFEKGMILNSNKNKFIDGSYSFGLNLVKDDIETDPSSVQNENGFKLLTSIGENTILLGQVELNDQSAVIFTVTSDSKTHKISLLNIDGEVTDLYSNTGLNFQPNRQIEGTYKFNSFNQRIVYFTDDHNPIRVINVDEVLSDPSAIGSADDLLLFNKFTLPNVEVEVQDSGGALQTGGYQVFVRLIESGKSSTPWTIPTLTYYVTDDPTEEGWSDTTYLSDGVPSHKGTDKSLTVTISNIVGNYDAVEIGYVLIQDQIKSYKVIADPIAISGDTITTTITGSEPTIQAEDDAEILTDRIVYDKAKTITQKDKRLLIGNLTSSTEDYNFQEVANNIKVNYVIEEELVSEQSQSNFVFNELQRYDVTTPRQYNKSFMRDEVYSLGISFIYEGGFETRVYHIPGRESTSFDKQSISTSNPDAKAVAQPGETSIERWKVYNTASKSGLSGTLSYWESEIDYPTKPELGFPSGKIRHHKMPNGELEPIFKRVLNPSGETWDVVRRNLGIKVNNIVLDSEIAESIVGYRIWVQDRLSYSDRSIIAKGVIYNAKTRPSSPGSSPDPFNTLVHPFPGNNPQGIVNDQKTNRDWSRKPAALPSHNDSRWLFFDSPDTLHYKPVIPNFLKVENKLVGTIWFGKTDADNSREKLDNSDIWYNVDVVYAGRFALTENPPNNAKVRKIRASKYISPNSVDSGLSGFSTVNKVDNTNGVFTTVLEMDDKSNLIPNTEDNSLWGFDANYEVSLNYKIRERGLNDAKKLQAYYVSLYNYNPRQYGSIEGKIYKTNGKVVLGTKASTHFLGDTFIDSFANKINASLDSVVGEYDRALADDEYARRGYSDMTAGTQKRFVSTSINTFMVESYINHRYRDDDPIPFTPGEPRSQPKEYFPKSASTGVINWLRYNSVFNNYMSIRPDFSVIYSDKIGVGITSFDILGSKDSTAGDYSTRVAYSQQDSGESLVDNYREFLANNYRDLQKNKGELWKLYVHNDALYGACENTTWNIYTSERSLITTGETIAVGTGEFLGLEPKELFTIDSGYAGTRSQWAFAQSPYGLLFVDELRGKVFLFTDKLEEISFLGTYKYFYNNGPISLQESLDGFENIDNPANPRGVGYTASYDSKLKRFILTKRDYKFIGDDPSSDFSNPDQFENKSFTLSFSPISATKQWISTHSYLPTNQFNIKKTTILKDTTQLGETNQSLYIPNIGDSPGVYFDRNKTHPFIIEIISNKAPLETKVFDNIICNLEVKSPYIDDADLQHNIRDKFFDRVLIYSDEFCSGYIELVPGNNTRRTERNWNLTTFRDITENYNTNTFLKNWNDLDYRQQYPIDKVLNQDKINVNKPWYEQQRFRDKYLGVRFYSDNLENTKFIINFVNSIFRKSYR